MEIVDGFYGMTSVVKVSNPPPTGRRIWLCLQSRAIGVLEGLGSGMRRSVP